MSLYIKDQDKVQFKTDLSKALENFMSSISQDNTDNIYSVYVLETKMKKLVAGLEVSMSKAITKTNSVLTDKE